ncbi:MAG TPA: caspase family protein, partial [Thermoanaerobaculia bacterium]
MTRAHALVIGIDRYKNKEWELTGAVRDALAFADWAVKSGGVDPANLTLLLSPVPKGLKTKRATEKAIREALRLLRNGAAKDVDRLWFYYAGHGMAPPGSGTTSGPIVVPCDVGNIDDYLNETPIGLEIFRGQMENVGPKEQVFFVDACRNAIPLKDNKILAQNLLWEVQGLDDDKLSTQAILLGTTAGQKAKEVRGRGLFGRALIAGLKGLGPDLRPPAAPPAVNERLMFNDLTAFVTERVVSGYQELTDIPAEEKKGLPYGTTNRVKGNLAIAEFAPPLPTANIEAIVAPAAARSKGRVEFLAFQNGKWVASDDPKPVAAPPPLPDPVKLAIRGGTHHVRITAPGFKQTTETIFVCEDKAYPFTLEEEKTPELVFLENARESVIPRGAAGRRITARPKATKGSIALTCRDRNARLSIVDGGGTEIASGHGEIQALDVAVGPYKAVAELTGLERVERTIVVEGGTKRVPLEIATPRTDRIADILRDHKIQLVQNYADIEGLGEVANIRLGSLLAYAAWSVRWPNELTSLHAAGVDPLDTLDANGSALQVLIGDLEGAAVQIEGAAQPLKLTRLPKLPAVQGAAMRMPGSIRVRVEMPGFAPATFAVALLPHFITVLILTREADNDIDVQQHFMPIDVNRQVGPGFAPPRLDDVRLVELAWRALEGRDPLRPDEYRDLLYGKRSNPMLAVIAGYRMFGTPDAGKFGVARENLQSFFPELPDVHVLAGLYDPPRRDEHFERALNTGTPVLAKGFWVLTEWIGAKAIANGLPAPPLQESLLPGLAWTAFTEHALA